MFNKDQHPESFRHEFVREVIFPLVAVLIIIWSAASFSLLWTSHHNNAEAVTQQESIIKTAFVQSMTEHQRQLHSLTNWPPFGQLLQQPQIDLGWLDDNVGRWLYEMFGHQDIFIIDPQETILAGWQNGQRIDNSRWPAFEKALAPWLQGHSTEDKVDFTRVQQRAAMVAIGDISAGASESGYRLVSIKYLDDGF